MLASSVHKHVLHHNDSCIIMVKFNNFLYIVLYLIHYLTCDRSGGIHVLKLGRRHDHRSHLQKHSQHLLCSLCNMANWCNLTYSLSHCYCSQFPLIGICSRLVPGGLGLLHSHWFIALKVLGELIVLCY